MNNVAVACWSITNNPGHQAGTAIDQIPALSRHISFDTVMASAVNEMANHPTRIFIAPEYLFTERDSNPADENRTMIPASRSQKHAIYGRLRLISSRYPTIFIIAGTIAYEKRALVGLGRKHSYNVCPVLYGGEIIKTIYKSEDDRMLQSDGIFGAKGNAETEAPCSGRARSKSGSTSAPTTTVGRAATTGGWPGSSPTKARRAPTSMSRSAGPTRRCRASPRPARTAPTSIATSARARRHSASSAMPG